jgi:hypothetical protein
MNGFYINKAKINSQEASLGEVLVLLLLSDESNQSYDTIFNQLIDKGYITSMYDDNHIKLDKYRVTTKGKMLLEQVLIDSIPQVKSEDSYLELAKALKEIYPEGKKEGTQYYWADGVALIVRRLKTFFKKYGNQYTDEQIINATKEYVESFKGNHLHMRLLKYFIFKEQKSVSGEIEVESDLLTYIENVNESKDNREHWTTQMI